MDISETNNWILMELGSIRDKIIHLKMIKVNNFVFFILPAKKSKTNFDNIFCKICIF